MNNLVEFVGYDANGHKRVWGTGYGKQQAADSCLKAAELYVVKRPDTGPLSGWKFEFEESV